MPIPRTAADVARFLEAWHRRTEEDAEAFMRLINGEDAGRLFSGEAAVRIFAATDGTVKRELVDLRKIAN